MALTLSACNSYAQTPADSTTPKNTKQTTPKSSNASAQSFKQSCTKPVYPSPTLTPIDSKCGVDGSGGAEANQNAAKNNFCPVKNGGATSIAALTQLQAQVQSTGNIPFGNPDDHPLSPTPGPATDRAYLQAMGEGEQVVLQGFVKIARQEGAESVNCETSVPNTPVYHDIHISIVANPSDSECSGVVAEMVPHHRPAAWTADLVESVATAKLPVQLTGHLMFDSSHTPCVNGAPIKDDPSRVSTWEVHPIYRFQVCPSENCQSGGWVDLANWKPAAKEPAKP